MSIKKPIRGGTRMEYGSPDGSKFYRQVIINNPKKGRGTKLVKMTYSAYLRELKWRPE